MMAASPIPNNSRHASCSLCRVFTEDPVYFPVCYHPLCKQCMARNLTRPGSFAPSLDEQVCPLCKLEPYGRPRMLNGERASLNNNGPVLLNGPSLNNNAVVVRNDAIVDAIGTRRCTMCGTKAMSQCTECALMLCETCVLVHQRVHRVVAIPSFQRLQQEICPQHNCRMPIYCQDCQFGLCRKCDVAEHVHHYIVKVQSENNESRAPDFEDLICDVKLRLPYAHGILDKVELMKSNVENRVKVNYSEITATIHSCIKALEKRQDELLSQLETTRKLKLDILSGQANDMENAIITFNKFLKIFETDTNELPKDLDVFETVRLVQRYIKYFYMLQVQEPLEDDRILYSPDKMLQKQLSTTGHLYSGGYGPKSEMTMIGLRRHTMVNMGFSFLIGIRDHKGDPVKTRTDRVSVTCQYPDETSKTPIITNNNDGTYGISVKTPAPGLYTVSAFVNGLPVSRSPYKVNVYGPRDMGMLTQPLIRFAKHGSEFGELNNPWGLCCDREGRLLVADRGNHRIQVFNITGAFITSVGREGTAPGEFFRPSSVAIDTINRIVVVDKDNHRVQVFTPGFNFLFQFGVKGSKTGQFDYPWDVAINSKNQMAISDSRNHRVQLFSSEGIFIMQFGFESLGRKISPRGLVFSKDDRLFVSEFEQHRIIVLDKNFKFLNYVGIDTPGSGYRQFQRPQGIAMDEVGNLVVADSRNCRVQIVSADGSNFYSFGKYGKGPGQFLKPVAVCISHEGQIIVTDMVMGAKNGSRENIDPNGAPCIQIF